MFSQKLNMNFFICTSSLIFHKVCMHIYLFIYKINHPMDVEKEKRKEKDKLMIKEGINQS